MPDTIHPAIPMLAEIWENVAALCADLTEDQWLIETDCPTWTVKDQVAHIIGTERTLLGEQLPRDPVIGNHVRNELGAFNEAWVEHYRGWQGGEVLLEFGRIIEERLEALGRLEPGDVETETLTPLGILALGDFLNVRVVDCFAHEQDIRQATERAGHLDTAVAKFAVTQSLLAMPKAVAREAAAPDGSVVVFDVEGEAGERRAVSVSGRRGVLLDTVPDNPTCTLDLDVLTFLRLAWGRTTRDRAIDDALVGIAGDAALGRAVLASMNYMP